MKQSLLVLAFILWSMPSFADAIFNTGNHPQPNEQNILFLTDETGTTIDDFTNRSDTEILVHSTTNTLIGTGGQSDIDAVGGVIHDVSFSVPGHTFKDFIFNPFKPGANGDLVVTVVTNTDTFKFTYGNMHGDNFLTVTTKGGEVIDSVTVDSASGFQGLKQPRISGISGVALTPEPASLALLGTGLLATGLMIRRKSA